MNKMQKGVNNLITDVPGVKVGHWTCKDGDHQTGVTVVIPGENNPFIRKLTAAAFVLNGFGKSQGLVQIEELGTLETPIALTNTLNVGLVHDAMVQYMIDRCKADNVEVRSINPVVCECNDAYLNDIQRRIISHEQVMKAVESAGVDFELGAVGAGRGTVCYGFKGGIGSASRLMKIGDETYTMGILVQSNYGSREDLRLEGLQLEESRTGEEDKGSIIMVIATDLPLSARQLKRVIKRASVGMARLGSYIGHGSGEIMVGFTTADPHEGNETFRQQRTLREDLMNIPFRAVGECCEEAILRSMLEAETVTGYQGHVIQSIRDYMKEHK